MNTLRARPSGTRIERSFNHWSIDDGLGAVPFVVVVIPPSTSMTATTFGGIVVAALILK